MGVDTGPLDAEGISLSGRHNDVNDGTFSKGFINAMWTTGQMMNWESYKTWPFHDEYWIWPIESDMYEKKNFVEE